MSNEDPLPDNVTMHPAGHTGKLTTPDGEELPVRTFERGADVALVVLVDIDEHLDETDRLESAMLEYNSVRGVVRLRGEAVFEDRTLLRFKAVDAAEVMQRREFVRVHTPQPVTLEADDEMSRRSAHTVDLSGGGMLVSGADTLEVGDEVAFTIAMGDDQPIGGQARVVRVREDGKRALAFKHLSDPDRQRLIRFVFECMRTARARTRADWL
jgi:hypothetical protein